MKLYTEEQVNEILNRAGAIVTGSRKQMSEYLMKDLTPIEFPSDEEIWQEADKENFITQHYAFMRGTEWIKEQILKQNK